MPPQQFGIPGLPSQQPILFSQQAQGYSPFGNTGNPGLDMIMSHVAMPMLQSFMGGQFIPQQFPAQGLLDQMAASKWQNASRANLAQAGQVDQQAIYNTMAGIRAKAGGGPMSSLQQSQLDTFAGVVNNPATMMLAETMLGAQNAEDLFFGRRGSAVKLASAANRIGFHRADSVTGKDGMSEESLKAFSSQIYDNLYGPNADLNDVSGFSAGRVGDIMTDLSQRGLLPSTMGKLTAGGRRQAFRDVGGAGMTFSADATEDKAIKDAMDRGDSVSSITKLAGGAEAVRKVDATRVSNSIKGYTDALSAVRDIFGDSGMGNAPMQQLMAAMEALTQNSMSSMSPGKIENLMRRTQMAARDSGTSLEALMGLSARGGALADQYGLDRSLVAGSTITAMEHGKAMMDTDRFKPAFGRMDPNKAALTIQDQAMRADASPVGRYLAVASRLMAENTDAKGNVSGKFANSNMAKMVEAMKNGETSYYDTTENRTVNIYEEFGTNPDKIMGRMLTETGTSIDRFGAMYRDKNTQEFQIAGAARSAQAAGLKSKLGSYLASQTGIAEKIGGGLDAKQRSALSQQIGKGLSTALIDTVNHTMSAPERIATLKNAFNQSAIDYARQQLGPGASANEVMAYAQTISKAGAGNIMGFKTDADLEDFLSTRQADAGQFTQRQYGQGIEALRQPLNARTLAEGQERGRRNNNRAGILDGAKLDDGSNVLQRLSDMVGGKGSKSAVAQVLGAVDSRETQEKLLKGITGGEAALESAFKNIQIAYSKGVVDTVDEKEKFVAGTSDANFATRKAMFLGTDAEKELKDKTRYMKDSEVANALSTAMTSQSKTDAVKNIYKAQNQDKSAAEIDAIFSDPTKTAAAMAELAKVSGIENIFEQNGIKTGIGADVMTEARFRKVNERTDAVMGTTPAQRARVFALGKLAKSWNDGSTKGEDILAGYGIDAKDKTLTDAMTKFMDKSGDIDSVEAQLKKLNYSPQQISDVVTSAQFSRNVNDMNGLGAGTGVKAAEVAATAARQTAFEKAVADGKVSGRMAELSQRDRSKMTDAQRAADKRDAATIAAEEKELKEFYATEGGFTAGLDASNLGANGGKDAKDMRKGIIAEAEKITSSATGAGSASDPMGIGSAISSSIGPAIADAFKSAVSEIAKAAGFGGALTLSGNITLNGLDSVIAALEAKIAGQQNMTPTPSGAIKPTATAAS
jgi:hypothetical protein